MKVILSIIWGLLFSISAYSGTISLVGAPQVTAEPDNDGYRVKIEFGLTNRGTETAVEVYPEVRIGSWVYKGDKEDIRRGAEARWETQEVVSADKLTCHSESCQKLGLNEKGKLPVFITTFYKDINGHQFSKADMGGVYLGPFENGIPQYLNGDSFRISVKLESDLDEFTYTVNAKSLKGSSQKLVTTLFTTQDVELEREPVVIEFAPFEEKEIVFEGENDTGLRGSTYQVFSVFEWDQGSYRVSQSRSAYFRVPVDMPKYYWIWFGIFSVIVSALSVVYVVKGFSFKKS